MSARADKHFNAPLQQPHGVFASTSHYGGCTDADRHERKAAAVRLQPGQEPQVRAGPVFPDLSLGHSEAPGSLFSSQDGCYGKNITFLYKVGNCPRLYNCLSGRYLQTLSRGSSHCKTLCKGTRETRLPRVSPSINIYNTFSCISHVIGRLWLTSMGHKVTISILFHCLFSRRISGALHAFWEVLRGFFLEPGGQRFGPSLP